MNIKFKILLDSEKPESAIRALKKMRKENRAEFEIIRVEKYFAEGCEAICAKEIEFDSWENFVFHVIGFAQTFGCGWTISGRIDEELNLTTTRFHSGSGVSFAQIAVSKQGGLAERNPSSGTNQEPRIAI